MDAFRSRYSDYLWKGEFKDSIGAEIEMTPTAPISYSLFLHSGRRLRAIVLINDDPKTSHEATLKLSRNSSLNCASPENPELQRCGSQVVVPARSALVVFESE